METLIRGLAVYLILLVLFRLTGKRTLAETTPFELTNALILVVTLVGIDVGLGWAKDRANLSAARETHGIANPEEIEYAVLETDGSISVIPVERQSPANGASTPSTKHRRTS